MNNGAINDFVTGKVTFGALGDPEQKRIDAEARRIGLERATPDARKKFHDDASMDLTPEGRTVALGKLSRLSRGEGADPLAPKPGEAKKLAEGRKGWLDRLNDAFTEERFPEDRRKAAANKPRAINAAPAADWTGPTAGGGDFGGTKPARPDAAAGAQANAAADAMLKAILDGNQVLAAILSAVKAAGPGRPLLDRPRPLNR